MATFCVHLLKKQLVLKLQRSKKIWLLLPCTHISCIMYSYIYIYIYWFIYLHYIEYIINQLNIIIYIYTYIIKNKLYTYMYI